MRKFYRFCGVISSNMASLCVQSKNVKHVDQGACLSRALYGISIMAVKQFSDIQFPSIVLKREIQFPVFVLTLCNSIILTHSRGANMCIMRCC